MGLEVELISDACVNLSSPCDFAVSRLPSLTARSLPELFHVEVAKAGIADPEVECDEALYRPGIELKSAELVGRGVSDEQIAERQLPVLYFPCQELRAAESAARSLCADRDLSPGHEIGLFKTWDRGPPSMRMI